MTVPDDPDDPDGAKLVQARTFGLALAMGDHDAAAVALRRLFELDPDGTRKVIEWGRAMLDMDDDERLRAFPWLRHERN